MKSNDPHQKRLEVVMLAAMKEGTVAVPTLLLKHYPRLGLTELEVMILIQLIAFMDKEQNDFPTVEEIQAQMSAKPELVIVGLQKLLKERFLAIDEEVEEETGIRYERYNLDQLYTMLVAVFIEQHAKEEAERQLANGEPSSTAAAKDIFSIIEKEFARPLTPMELETISGWLDKDGYREELILAALKEAVFAGKVHFRYIDRILLEWSRNRVVSAEQAKEYTQKFRGTR
jgi:DNA replication protein